MEAIVRGDETLFDVVIELQFTPLAPALVNDEVQARVVQQSLAPLFGEGLLTHTPKVMGAEDFACLATAKVNINAVVINYLLELN
ncbi:amidohydrolase [Pantoea sp. Ap-967]|uniref:amidohydrolase n=1 Tax=Pantoea sp. Ap-967 TaxID=2608362 RepID=UPI00142424F5|nr:amidohydrolase [Pantoea sp. Ap-967]NIE73309.1 amidohydrolase [Pantoea sp. Ap-967]